VSRTTGTTLDKRLSSLEKKVVTIKEDLRDRLFHDSMDTARIREELDSITNVKKRAELISQD
jgi:hypothetical protein